MNRWITSWIYHNWPLFRPWSTMSFS